MSLLEQGIQLTGDKAVEEDRNRLLSGFKGEKEKCKYDLVDKKWADVARRKVLFVRGVHKSRMRPCHEPGEKHKPRNWTIIKHGSKRSSAGVCSQANNIGNVQHMARTQNSRKANLYLQSPSKQSFRLEQIGSGNVRHMLFPRGLEMDTCTGDTQMANSDPSKWDRVGTTMISGKIFASRSAGISEKSSTCLLSNPKVSSVN
ncbi:hypothetical protein WISP_118287 [Willisornis vidua]|uniref:Uncharacterized protein n=1 Tax=Willisornis vidua TaxID=1566151 RepID=A0ABQ9CZB8_9PASS|nr:hypothetical protein WISP_118287 [Willisornis vidua]